jgi:hypothetical protein
MWFLLGSGTHMIRRMHRGLLAAAILLVGAAATASATEYPGWGDTGWIYANKRDCCNEAIAIASQYSAQACVTAGGAPTSFTGGGQRGSCTSQFMQDDDGVMMYRCYGEASVWCR